jgi:hypothetical protein
VSESVICKFLPLQVRCYRLIALQIDFGTANEVAQTLTYIRSILSVHYSFNDSPFSPSLVKKSRTHALQNTEKNVKLNRGPDRIGYS